MVNINNIFILTSSSSTSDFSSNTNNSTTNTSKLYKILYKKDIKFTVFNHKNNYYVWKYMIKHNIKEAFIIDDDTNINKNFWDLFFEYNKEVPKDWDILYLGCTGSCEKSAIKDVLYQILNNKKSTTTYIKNKKMYFVYEPALPLGLYAYVVNLKAAKKLIKNINKENNNIDLFVADKLRDKLNIYAVDPVLVTPNTSTTSSSSSSSISMHPSINPNNFSIYNSKYVYYSKNYDLGITYYSIIMWLAAIIMGYTQKYTIVTVEIFTFIQLLDMAHNKTDKKVIKNLLFELILFYMLIYLFSRIKKN